MTSLSIKFTKDKFWKRFVRFNFESDDTETRDKKVSETETSSASSNRFLKIQRSFISVYDTFFLHFPFQTVMSEIQLSQLVDQKLREFCNEKGVAVEKTDETEIYQLSDESILKAMEIVSEIISISRALDISSKGSVVQLSSQFDILVGEIVSQVIDLKPEILNSSERKIEYGDLYGFDSLENLRQHFSERFVESIIRKSRTEQFSWFGQVLKIPMTKNLESWPVFIEINERRNLFTHTDGVVSSAYLKNCRDAGYETADLKVGDKLSANFDYCKTATAIFFEIGLKLIQVVWRKILPKDISSADRALVDTSFKLIVDDRIPIALEIHKFENDVLKNVESERHRRVLLVNYANCYNLQDQRDKANEILSRVDWSASGLDFQVCVAAVRRDAERVISLMRRAVTADALTAEDFRTWPVFRKIHGEAKFREEYKAIFGREFVPDVSTTKIDLVTLKDFVSEWLERERLPPENFSEIIANSPR